MYVGEHGRDREQVRVCLPNYNSLPFSKGVCFETFSQTSINLGEVILDDTMLN